MTDKQSSRPSLRRLLETTRDEELDCDRFQELVASWIDGRIADPALRALLEHHRQQCPECGEELEILRRALESDAG
ncbi:MAG TPA: hypothetical protein VNO55_04760 [Polyangia bacterium]|nr:hypothetical protein [Polyangia bacterium]